MRKKRKSENSGFNIWRSYSDMMAGVLLLFVLIMCVTLFQAQKSYDESIKERDEKIAMQEAYTLEILAQQSELDEKDWQLKSQDEKLAKQEMLLAELAATLKEQEALLNAAQIDLNEKTTLLATQQQQIDQIIGVKADVIASLKTEFANNDVSVDIDAQTGALTLDANVMFDVDEAELTDEGKEALRAILPIYCKVLLEEDHMQYLAEIIIDGYTDTDGDYAYNLELSQRRSLAVAQYLLDIQYEFLNESQIASLEDYLTVNGHSMANPILDAEGNVDKEASRRVEVKFRLKDDEMIEQLNNILIQLDEELTETGETAQAEETKAEETKTEETKTEE